MARTYPAIDVRWPSAPADDLVDRALAEIDAASPSAVEYHSHGIRVFFLSQASRERAITSLTSLDPAPACTRLEIPDEDWAARSQASLGAITVDRIVVAPPWARQSDQSALIQLVIQPSMGFGTGHHASTRLCLRLLQRLDVNQKHVIDVGTGSGILAIAAARLGAGRVLAVDSDPDALSAAADNVQLNGTTAVELKQLDVAADADAMSERFDLVLANLTGFLLIRHATPLARLVEDRGALIVSGFEQHEVDEVNAAFAGAGWNQDLRLDEDGWVGLTLFRGSYSALRNRL